MKSQINTKKMCNDFIYFMYFRFGELIILSFSNNDKIQPMIYVNPMAN